MVEKRQTKTALQNFETPFLIFETPLLQAETPAHFREMLKLRVNIVKAGVKSEAPPLHREAPPGINCK